MHGVHEARPEGPFDLGEGGTGLAALGLHIRSRGIAVDRGTAEERDDAVELRTREPERRSPAGTIDSAPLPTKQVGIWYSVGSSAWGSPSPCPKGPSRSDPGVVGQM